MINKIKNAIHSLWIFISQNSLVGNISFFIKKLRNAYIEVFNSIVPKTLDEALYRFLYLVWEYSIALLIISIIYSIVRFIIRYIFAIKSDENIGMLKASKSDVEVVCLNALQEERNDYIKKSLRDLNRRGDKLNTLFVFDFAGDEDASLNIDNIINTIISSHQPGDEVLLRLDSGGGYVSSYGLAASNLKRLRDLKNLHFTISVDKCAASGGYMIAAVADHIICAPFAIVGSIGVITEELNYNSLLKKFGIEVELHTAGEDKRNITSLGENTEEKRQKLIADLRRCHELFKLWIANLRPNLDIEEVATGKTFYGSEALTVGLIDEVLTSSEFLQGKMESGKYKILFMKNIEVEKPKPMNINMEVLRPFLGKFSTALSYLKKFF